MASADHTPPPPPEDDPLPPDEQKSFSRSERKREREIQRRKELARAFNELEKWLRRVDPSFDEDMANERLPTGGHHQSDPSLASTMTRFNLVSRTTSVLKRLYTENIQRAREQGFRLGELPLDATHTSTRPSYPPPPTSHTAGVLPTATHGEAPAPYPYAYGYSYPPVHPGYPPYNYPTDYYAQMPPHQYPPPPASPGYPPSSMWSGYEYPPPQSGESIRFPPHPPQPPPPSSAASPPPDEEVSPPSSPRSPPTTRARTDDAKGLSG